MTNTVRQIFKSNLQSRHEVRDLLQSIFAAELTVPGRCIWLVSPWISDVAILDNQTGSFSGIDHTWGRRSIRLLEVLRRLLWGGMTVVIATRPDVHNKPFIDNLRIAAENDGTSERLVTKQSEDLHEKGLLGDTYYLSGSMNLTYNGIELLQEAVKFDTAPESVSMARLAFHNAWGGLL